MAAFRTRFWELLSEKELKNGTRHNNVSEMARAIGVSRVTFYKYADESMNSVDADTVRAFMQFLGLKDKDLPRFLVIDPRPQLDAQEELDAGLQMEPA